MKFKKGQIKRNLPRDFGIVRQVYVKLSRSSARANYPLFQLNELLFEQTALKKNGRPEYYTIRRRADSAINKEIIITPPPDKQYVIKVIYTPLEKEC